MAPGFIMALQLILGLSILVFIHELGHYAAARMFKIKVEKFFLFFDIGKFKLFSFKIGDTEYGIGWLPFGGYVKIAGMVDESMDREQMKQPPQPWEFRSKPAWQRLIVMLAGVIMNLITGIVIFTFVILHYEKEYLPVSSVSDGIYAYKYGRDLGFKTGDKIIAVNGKKIERTKDALTVNVMLGAKLTVEREGRQMTLLVPESYYATLKKSGFFPLYAYENFPFTVDSVITGYNAYKAGIKKGDRLIKLNDTVINTYGQFREILLSHKSGKVTAEILRDTAHVITVMNVDETGKIGITVPSHYKDLKNYSFFTAIKYGVYDAIDLLTSNIKGFKKIFKGEEKAQDALQGPIGIARIYGGVWDWAKFWFITGLLSIILAFMNILPIPALDGGHVLFVLIELITGKRFSDKFLERVQLIGMIILFSLMAFVIGNDILKIFR